MSDETQVVFTKLGNTSDPATSYTCSECSRFGQAACPFHSPHRFQQPQVVVQQPTFGVSWPYVVEQAAVKAYEAMERYWLDLTERQAVLRDDSEPADEKGVQE